MPFSCGFGCRAAGGLKGGSYLVFIAGAEGRGEQCQLKGPDKPRHQAAHTFNGCSRCLNPWDGSPCLALRCVASMVPCCHCMPTYVPPTTGVVSSALSAPFVSCRPFSSTALAVPCHCHGGSGTLATRACWPGPRRDRRPVSARRGAYRQPPIQPAAGRRVPQRYRGSG